METYIPPYTLTDAMVNAVARIAEKCGRVSSARALDAKPQLRRSSRIRSIHASLAIEANSLSLDEVRSVISGKAVIGSAKEIQEVINACNAYEQLGRFDPYSLEDLKRLHGIMSYMTVRESGVFRTHNEGVFEGGRCVFMAPPPQFVPDHMQSLFAWMNRARGEVHPLILSSVFHYEFIFIHPFEDGNGRMARLWQTALLADWNPVFQYLPTESRIHALQSGYYRAIAACNARGNSDAFITFMLEAVDQTLDWALTRISVSDAGLTPAVQRLMDIMEPGVPYSMLQLMGLLGLKSKASFRKACLLPAMDQGLVAMRYPDKPNSRNQAYIRQG